MTKEEADKKGFSIEPYGGGFIIADYSGKRGEASYCGKEMKWSSQPIVQPPFFETEEEALEACDKE